MGKVKVFLAQMRGSSWMGEKVSSFHALPLQINLIRSDYLLGSARAYTFTPK